MTIDNLNGIFNWAVLCTVVYFLSKIAIVPAVRRIALSKNLVDDPSKGERKLHTTPIPYLGGVAIFCGVLLGFAAFLIFFPTLLEAIKIPPWSWVYLAGGGLVLALGTADDLYDIPAKRKLLAQIFIAVLIFFGGIKLDHIVLPSVGIVEFGQLSLPITVMAFLVAMNAINLIDGLDGLACGVALVAVVANAALAIHLGSMHVFLFAMIIASSLLVFISYNYHPARMFLGDGGSLLLGYLIAVIGIQNIQISGDFAEVMIPVLAIIYPILDIGIAIIRRGMKGKPFMSADRAHIHHKLLDLGLGQRSIFWFVIGFTSIAVISCSMFLLGLDFYGWVLAVLFVAVSVVGLISLKYLNIKNVRSVMRLRPVFKKHNAFRNLINVRLKYAEDEDEIRNLLINSAKEYNIGRIVWNDGDSRQVVHEIGSSEGDQTNCDKIRVIKLERTGGEIEFSIPGDVHDDLQIEIDTIMRAIVRAMDKSLYRLRHASKAKDLSGKNLVMNDS